MNIDLEETRKEVAALHNADIPLHKLGRWLKTTNITEEFIFNKASPAPIHIKKI